MSSHNLPQLPFISSIGLYEWWPYGAAPKFFEANSYLKYLSCKKSRVIQLRRETHKSNINMSALYYIHHFTSVSSKADATNHCNWKSTSLHQNIDQGESIKKVILETYFVLLALYMQYRCFSSLFWSKDMNTAMLTCPSVLQYFVNTSFGIGIVIKVASILSKIAHFVFIIVFKNKIDLLSLKNL